MKQAPQVCCCKLGNILEIKPERVNGKLDVREAWGRKDYGPGSFEVKWTTIYHSCCTTTKTDPET